MVEMFKGFYRMGMPAETIYITVVGMPAFGLTPLDYEEITGQPWPDKKENQ
ncbi:hypothetical protein [Weissella minor]|uniref:hypothetical protein n=1 Tax=Weissella minor TaxID=1620 RepID=UPI003AF22A4F